MNTNSLLPTKLAAVLAGLLMIQSAFAQGTAFTYQGRLDNNGSPANASFDLRFSLHDSASGGLQVGPVLTNAPVSISNGLFTVTLDFGNQFPGAARWLEIGVRTNGDTKPYSTLAPRQALAAAPYAVQALNAANAANITGTIALAQLPATVVTNGASGINLVGSFSGNAAGLSNMSLASLSGPLTVSPDAPANIGHVVSGGFANDVAVSGNYAYVANDTNGLRVYSITNPAAPVNVGQVNSGGRAVGVTVSGSFAYLANAADGLRIYSITNPAAPVSVGHFSFGTEAQSVAVSGNFAYVALITQNGLGVLSITNPAAPVSLGFVPSGGFASDVTVSGNYAYLANYNDGLRIYSITNPAAPVNVGHINNGGYANGVAVSGNYAYLANDSDGLRIYSITNPAAPVNVAHIANPGAAISVTVSGNYAYLANADDGLRIYSITKPAAPVEVGHIDNGGLAFSVAVSGNYAYLANGADGLRSYVLGLVSAPSFRTTGQLSAGGDLTVGGEIVAGSGATFAGLVTASSFGGSGSNLTGLNASALTSGTVADNRLSANVALRSGGNSFGGNQTLLDGNLRLPFYGGILVQDGAGNYRNSLIPRWGDEVTYLDLATNGLHIRTSDGLSSMRILGNGRVGLGTESPQKLLQVGDINVPGSEGMIRLASRSTVGGALRAWDIGVPETGTNAAGVGYSFVIDDSLIGAGQPEFLIRWDTGNVGIGRYNPRSRLHVTADSSVADGITVDNAGTGDPQIEFLEDGERRAAISYVKAQNRLAIWDILGGDAINVIAGGNVGIGTTNPAANDLQINDRIMPADGYGLVVSRADYGADVQINRPAGTGGIGLLVDNFADGDSSTSLLLVRNNNATEVAMNVRADGRTQVKELEITGGADLSEPFNITDNGAKPGMVMAIDPDKPGELRIATAAYDRTVAGIISGAGGVKPGLTLRQHETAADGSHPVALSGRVYCWVDADANGPVRPGDLLTTSDTPGHAMRATDHARANGALIGKAMTRLETGRGLVLVLVSLQ